MDTASTWDSYKPTLLKILHAFIPKRVLEWGIGESTQTFLSQEFISTLDSIEHSPEWFSKFKNLVSERFNLIFEPDIDLYPHVNGRFEKYDLIFVDGRVRELCLNNCHEKLEDEGIVVLHDSKRPQYKEAIGKFKYAIFEDNGHTAVMTNNKEVFEKLVGAFDESRHTST